MDKIVRCGYVEGSLMPPSSKSYAQRALAISLLTDGGVTVLKNVELCDDTRYAMRCIEVLGAKVTRIGETTLSIVGGLNPSSCSLNVGESGLSARLFTPIASLCSVPITISGQGTLLYRPMHFMINSLLQLGVEMRDGGGYLPIEVCGPIKGGEIDVDGSISSQFLTGLLLSVPMADQETTIRVNGAVSKPYIDMTIDAADKFGVKIFHNNYEEFYISGRQKYQPIEYAIEGDWSGAAIMLVAGAIAGEVRVENISLLSKQADTAICTALASAGARIVNEQSAITVLHQELHPFEFDATECPDLFPALAALASTIEGESIIVGTSRLEHKECHRAEAIYKEFTKLGVKIDISTDNIMKIRGGKIGSGRVSSHNDHRMAMALAVVALRSQGDVIIEGAESISKSYPNFFEELDKLRI